MNPRLVPPSDYPVGFREIPDPPNQLYAVGQWPLPTKKVFLTVVGSRRCSAYGQEVCHQLIESLTGLPIVIVSGLALGIDALAHRWAIKHQLTTIAWPGSGLNPDCLYPPSHRQLADKIVEAGGALLSEYRPETRADKYTFPRRNRLMAGMSVATLVIEAEIKSGSLITARLAVDYNREVLAVPGTIFSPQSRGTLELIRQGATPINSGDDLRLALGFQVGKTNDSRQQLTDTEQRIRQLLTEQNLTLDELWQQLKLPINELSATLSTMELKHLVKEDMGWWQNIC